MRILLLLFGVFCCSTAVIMIKASHVHPVLLSSYRLLVAALVLTPAMLRDYRRSGRAWRLAEQRRVLVPGALLAVHFISWISGARMTPAANASLIVNLVPIVMPFLMFLLVHESVTRRELAGTALAVLGLLLLSGADFRLSREHFWGDIVCLGSMLVFAVYLALGRRNRDAAGLWLYVVPLYYVAGVLCFLAALFFANPVKVYPLREVGLIAGLGIVPTVIGHSILNHSMRTLRGQIVSILNMGQFVFAGLMALVFYNEVPRWTFFVASVLLVGGVCLALDKVPQPKET